MTHARKHLRVFLMRWGDVENHFRTFTKKLRTDGRSDGRTDGRMDGWTDGRMDGRTDKPSSRDAMTLLKIIIIILLIHESKMLIKICVFEVF